MDSTLQDSTRRRLRAIALDRQRTGRVPGLAAAVVRRGELLWTDGIGTVDVSAPRVPGPDDQFLVASNTKSFTAVLVMALRDEGRLDLDDRLDEHLPGVTHRATVRQALAHATGLAREPLGDIWETLEQPDLETLMADFNAIERVGRPTTGGTTPTSSMPCSASSSRGSTAARGRSRCGRASSSRSA